MKYLLLYISFVIVVILSIRGGKEIDNPNHPVPITFVIHFL